MTTEAPKRRRRPPSACIQCRRRKIKCDQNAPCDQCIRSKSDSCTYEPADPIGYRKQRHSGADGGSDPPSASNYSFSNLSDRTLAESFTPTRQSPSIPSNTESYKSGTGSADSIPSNVQALATRVSELEKRLADLTCSSATEPSHARLRGQPTVDVVFNKTRLFGRNHWMYAASKFSTLMDLRDQVVNGKHADVSTLYVDCKNLARDIKAHESSGQTSSTTVRCIIPPKQDADDLVSAYFRTGESMHRILHVPSFQRDYNRYWQQPEAANPAFVVQMLLVFAIGSFFQPGPTSYTSQRNTTLRWIRTGQEWLDSPFAEKQRLTLTGIQSHCLLLIAREINGVGADLIWIAAGSLVRRAILMGFHRDPVYLPTMSAFETEMRRRLWATIIELSLQSCMNCGSPPLISATDYDCKPPSNINDSQIDSESHLTPISKPMDHYTESTLQIAIMRTFSTRLGIAKASTAIREDLTYEGVLQLSAEMQQDYAAVIDWLKNLKIRQAQPTRFQAKQFDLLNIRFLLTLHQHYSYEARTNHIYMYSRKVCVESSLSVLSPYAHLHTSESNSNTTSVVDKDMYRLTLLGQGMYRCVPIQAVMAIYLDLLDKLREGRSVFHGAADSMVEKEMSDHLRRYASLSEERVEAGETNVNGFAFAYVILEYIEAIREGVPPEARMISVLRESLASGYEILKERAAESATATPAYDSPEYDESLLDSSNAFWSHFNFGQGGQSMDFDINMDFLE